VAHAVTVFPPAFRWTRDRYDRAVELGILTPQDQAELVDGLIVCKARPSPAHAGAIRLADRTLRQVFDAPYEVWTQLPLALGDVSEPEPDVMVVPWGTWSDSHHHPTTAVLVVEVADLSLDFDRTSKAKIYAMNGILDYWIVNLRDLVLEVHRQPSRDGVYTSVTQFTASDVVTPLAAPQAPIRVDRLLPS
jgi:Uma2 family endonuclease